uniref:Tetraspanin-9-like n=1 Tax=Crassostrea virginica TaxID=6565 RepID=A0A8B8DDV5_CRAVI|nr:tetraspanin-9-like [Crassostrea virginica]
MALPYARVFVVFVNSIYVFLLLGLVGVALSVYIMKITSPLTLYKGSVISDINRAITATGLGPEGYYDDSDLVTFVSGFLLVVAVAGLFVLVVALAGCCGGCCRNSGISKLYVVALILMLVVELIMIIVIYGFNNTLMWGSIKSTMTTVVMSKYQGLVGNNTETFGWNFIMAKYQCCGVYGYSDFKEASAWRSDVVAGGTSYSLSVPIVCCDQLPTSTDLSCAGATTGINANKGCFDELWKLSVGSLPMALLGLGVGVCLQIMLIIASCDLSSKDKKRIHSHSEDASYPVKK